MAGYSHLAIVIGKNRELATFRKFSVLNAKNLLYMQGELIHLEAELKMIAGENMHSNDAQKADFEFSISSLIAAHASEDGDEHWAKILEIREKLKEYTEDEALCRFQRICAFEQPDNSDLKILQDWLGHAQGGNHFLKGYEADTWDELNKDDLVSMTSKSREKDCLSKWIDVNVIPFYHHLRGRRHKDPEILCERGVFSSTSPLYCYSDSKAHAAIEMLSTTLASLLPTMSAFVLYFVRSPIARLGGVVAFTILFSVVFAVIARARRAECFAATTAFAAVLVVFVGNVGPPA